MSITVIGVNHKTATVDIREKIAFSPVQTGFALKSSLSIVDESLILSTCNRTEIYAVSKTETNTSDELSQWLADFHHLDKKTLKQYLYTYKDGFAVKHAFRVACGLDSMILGEPQILGQLKNSLKLASEYKTSGRTLNKLLQHAFTTAKKIRTETNIGANAVSVAYAAASLAKRIFSDLSEQTALMIGAGETIELVMQHLQSQGIKHIIVANRNLDNAQKLIEKFDGEAIKLTDIADHLHRADIVISSTASPLPVIGKGSVERALKERRHKPMFMVDIAIPRDIEPEVNQLDDAYLYTVDDLQSVINENLKSRELAAQQAESMILNEVDHFLQWQQAQKKMNLIKQYRKQNEVIRDEALAKARKMLQNGKDPEEILQQLAHNITNKLSHPATIALNTAARQGDLTTLRSAQVLLNLDETNEY